MVNAVVPFLPVWFGSVLSRTDAARQVRLESNTQVCISAQFSYYNNNTTCVYSTAALHAGVTPLHVLRVDVMHQMTEIS